MEPSMPMTDSTTPQSGSRSLPIREFLIPAPVSGITPSGKRRQLEEQKNLFFQFIRAFLQLDSSITVVGLQPSWGAKCGDQIVLLFNAGGSMCVPVNLLMEPVDIARAMVAAEIAKFEQSFEASR
jgi:hypothetical protein